MFADRSLVLLLECLGVLSLWDCGGSALEDVRRDVQQGEQVSHGVRF